MPILSETIMIERDLSLLRYTGGKLHVSMISSKASVELIRKAKREGLNVSCDVGVNYLKFADIELEGYDTNLKVNPPYRTEVDRQALLEGVLDGTIDALVSDHQPHDEESKKLEFDLASFGSSNLQAFWPIVNEVFGKNLDSVLECFTSKPRQILGIESLSIEVGNKAELTIFDTEETWTLNQSTNKSRSPYTPLWNKELKGKVVGIVNGGFFRTQLDEAKSWN